MDTYHLRPIEPKDVERVLGIISRNDENDEEEARQFFRLYFDENGVATQENNHFVIESGDELLAVGGYIALREDDACWIGFLYVDPYFQGQGIGRYLLGKILSDLKARNVRRVMVALDGEDIPTQVFKFYEVQGFSRLNTAQRPPIMNKPDTIVYACDLES